MSWFDRAAEAIASAVARGWFFCLCALLVVVWLPSKPLFGTGDTWQLVINTVTTVITFLLVALLQNSQRRFELSVHRKLDAVSGALADFMRSYSDHPDTADIELRGAVRKLIDAVGLEEQQGAS